MVTTTTVDVLSGYSRWNHRFSFQGVNLFVGHPEMTPFSLNLNVFDFYECVDFSPLPIRASPIADMGVCYGFVGWQCYDHDGCRCP